MKTSQGGPGKVAGGVSFVSFGGVGHALEWNSMTQLPSKYHENKPRRAGAGKVAGSVSFVSVVSFGGVGHGFEWN